jgi:hypothetical protein
LSICATIRRLPEVRARGDNENDRPMGGRWIRE